CRWSAYDRRRRSSPARRRRQDRLQAPRNSNGNDCQLTSQIFSRRLFTHAFYIQKEVENNLFGVEIDLVRLLYQFISPLPERRPVRRGMAGDHLSHDLRLAGHQIIALEILGCGAHKTGQPPGVKLADAAIDGFGFPAPATVRELVQRCRVETRVVFEYIEDRLEDIKPLRLQQAERLAGAALGKGQQLFHITRFDIHFVVIQNAAHIGIAERTERKLPAARADSWQEPRRRVRDQQKQDALRRLFKDFQNRVGGACVHLVDRIDDHDTPGALRRGELEKRAEGAHLIDPDDGIEALVLDIILTFENGEA